MSLTCFTQFYIIMCLLCVNKFLNIYRANKYLMCPTKCPSDQHISSNTNTLAKLEWEWFLNSLNQHFKHSFEWTRWILSISGTCTNKLTWMTTLWWKMQARKIIKHIPHYGWEEVEKRTLNLSDKIEGVTSLYLGTSTRSLS